MIATNDLVALGAKDALTVAGIEVPKRMSIMGFDDLGVETDRPLTTMRTDSAEVGRLAVRTLLDQIRGGTPAENRITVPTELVIRESTAPVFTGEKEPKHDSYLGPIARLIRASSSLPDRWCQQPRAGEISGATLLFQRPWRAPVGRGRERVH